MVCLVLLCMSSLLGCATTRIVTRAYFRPVVDLKEHGSVKIAVLPFSGPNSEGAAATMEGALAEWGYYDLVERRDLDAVLNEHGLQRQAVFDPETAVRVGKLAGASHVVLGDVRASSVDVRSETRYRTIRVRVGTDYMTTTNADGTMTQIPVPKYEGRREPYTYHTMSADARVAFRVVDVETSGILHGKEVGHNFNRGSADRSDLPTESGVLADLMAGICNEFRKQICPYSEEVSKKFLKPDSDNDASEKDVDRALQLIRAGDLEGAEEALNRAVESAADHAAAWFDLAMAVALQARVDEAIGYAIKALRLDPENDTIIEGKRWIESLAR